MDQLQNIFNIQKKYNIYSIIMEKNVFFYVFFFFYEFFLVWFCVFSLIVFIYVYKYQFLSILNNHYSIYHISHIVHCTFCVV